MLVLFMISTLALIGFLAWYTLFRLRLQRRRYHTLQQSAGEAVVVFNVEGKLIYASRSIQKVLGYSVAELLNMNIAELAHPKDAISLKGVMAQVMANPGVPVKGHTGRMRHGDGSWHWYEATVTNMLHNSDIKGIVDNFRDVTERVLAQEKTQNANRLYGFISQINQAIVQTHSEIELFAETCKIATEFGQFKMARVGIFDSTRSTVSFVKSCGIPELYLKRFVDSELWTIEPMFKVLESGTSYVCNHIGNSHHVLWKEFAQRNGIHSFIVLPLRKDNKIVGTLNLYADRAGFFSEQECKLLDEVVGDLSYALTAFERERSREQAEKKLLNSQIRLTQAQSIAHVGSFEIDFSTGISTWSDELCRIYGFEVSNNRHPFEDWFSMVHPEDIAHVQEIAERAKKSLSPSAIYHRIIRSDGSIRHIFSQGEYDLNEQGVPIGMHGVAHDITQFKESEGARHQSEQNLQLIMDLIPQGIFIKDRQGSYVFVNESFASWYGVSAEEFLGDSHRKFVETQEKTEIKKYLAQDQQVILSGETMIIPELAFTGTDGTTRYFYTVKVPYTLSGNSDRAMLGISSEITEQKIAQMERNRMMGDLLKRNKELEQFSYVVSHNVRAPLANIISLVSLLDPTGKCEDEQVLLALTESADKLHSVILDLNSILNMKHQRTESMESVDMQELVNDIKLSIADLIESSKVCITADFPIIKQIECYKSYLYSIFYNLILNGIKYRRQQLAPAVHITSEIEEGKLILRFKDNGLGIDLERHGHDLFGLYKRFHPGIDGKGMGLYMVKVHIEQLGGSIAVESTIGVGTTFTLAFDPVELAMA